jgi:hypothetical protein
MAGVGVCASKENLFEDISIGSKHNNCVRMMDGIKYYIRTLI